MKKDHLNESFGTLSETLNGLISLGYHHDFNIKEECLVCRQTNVTLSPEEFKIDKVYRFEGASDPEDASIVYAISSPKYNIKGTLVNGYGIYADDNSSELIKKLETHSPETAITKNEATPQRPEGDRLLNAPLVEMDVNKFIEQLKNETTWTDSDRNSLTLFKSDTLRIVLLGFHENAELKPHKANGVISVQVLEGKIKFITNEQTSLLEKGQMIALHENIMHSVIALKESFFLLTLALNKKQS